MTEEGESARTERLGWIMVSITIGALVLSLILYKLYGASLFGEVQAAGEVPEVVKVVPAVIRDHARQERAIGTVAATEYVELRNEVPGVVSHVGFRSGELVRKGALLVQLDTREERARLAAQLARAALAQRKLERARLLSGRGFITPAQVDELSAELSGARADADAIRATIRKKELRAPFAARVGIHDLQPGQYLAEGAPITTLQGVRATRYVDFTLPQQVAAVVKLGDRIRVSGTGLPSGGGEAVIIARDSKASGSRLVRYRVAVPQSDALLPGAFVDVTATAEQSRRVVMVPRTALIEKPHASYVFVVRPDRAAPGGARVSQRVVRAGPVVGEEVVISSGLIGNERIAADGAFKLRDGIAISPVEAKSRS